MIVWRSGVHAQQVANGMTIYPTGQLAATDFLVSVSGLIVNVKKDSIDVDSRIEERSTAKFIIEDRLGTKTYQNGQPVEIRDDDGNTIFKGIIDSCVQDSISPVGVGLWHVVKCADWHYLADKRIAAESYEDKTAGFIVDDLITNYLAAEGVSTGEVQGGATLGAVIINYIRVSDALDKLAEVSGFIWYINADKELYFVERSTTTAPWNVDTSDADNKVIKGSTNLSSANPKYRNSQFVLGGQAQTSSQVETQKGDGEKTAFATGFPIAKEPTIEVDTGGGFVTKTVGIKGVETGKDWYWSKGEAIVTQDTGGTPLSSTDEIKVTYIGLYEVIVQAQDEDAIADRLAIEGAGTGIVEAVADEPTIDDQDTAIDSALAKIAKFSPDAQVYKFQTERLGLAPGQLTQVTDSKYSLSSVEMLIESVRYRRKKAGYRCTVQAIVGPEQGSWSKFFKSLADIGQLFAKDIDIGTGTLIIFKQLTADWEWEAEITTIDVFGCDVPANDLYPENTRYPC